MVTKTEILRKFSSTQLKEIAVCEKIKLPKGTRKSEIIQKLIPLSLVKIKKYVEEYKIQPASSKPLKKKERKKAYNRGHNLEKKVAKWLRENFDFKTKLNDLVRGKAVKRPYEVDVHAIKEGWFSSTHLWVECKSLKVKRTHITKLVSSAEDVTDAKDEGIATWKPDMLLMVSDTGFDIDAIGWANKKKIFCLLTTPSNTEFVSKRTYEDFTNQF